MKRKLWTLLLALGAALALCVGASATEVNTADALTGDSVELNGEYKLTADITIDRSIVIKKEKSVTLDLDGHVLKYKSTANGSVIKVESGGHLTIQDSNTGSLSHKFTPNSDGLWVLDETSGTEEVKGGVITGGTGTLNFPDTTSPIYIYIYNGGGVYVAPGGALTMNGGSIVGCSGSGTINGGGGVYLGLNSSPTNPTADTFTMNGGRIIGCTAGLGGGVLVAPGCKFTMNAGAVIRSCTAQMGGGVYNIGNIGTSDSLGTFTLNGGTVESSITNSGTINADGGEITGAVTNSGTITGSGGVTGNSSTTFSGSVTNNGGTLTGFGKFTGSVTNNGGEIIGFCDFEKANLSGELTVTFDPDNGEQSFTRQVPWCKDGAALTEPSPAPTKDGYSFDGWGCGWDKWDFDTNKVFYTMTLTARWTENPPAPSYDDSDPTYAVSAPTAENGKIAVSPRYAERGERVTVTLTPDEGYELESLTVTDSRGNELTLTDKGDGRYTFTMPARRVEIKASFVKSVEVSPFADVAIDAYYYEAVKWAVKNGITDGVGNDRFAPEQPCTRAQVVTFLWRAAGSPVVNYAMDLSDVAEDAYYGEAVRWALSEGITTGTGESSFSPDATCTRAQAVTFLARALNANASGKAEFGDVPTDSYFAEAVAWAAANGVTEGVGGGLFGSDNSCTRGQIVTFLYRAYNK